MKDHIETMYQLEVQQNDLMFEFQKTPINEQVSSLNEKLDLKNYDKRKTDYILQTLNGYYVDNQVLMQVWKNWLKTELTHEFNRREGLISFFGSNPDLKAEMIAETFDFIKKKLTLVFENQTFTDEILVYNAALLFWDLGYKNALQRFIKKYQTICDEYFDQDDYEKINQLTENEENI